MISYSIISHTHTLYKEEALAEYVQTSLHKQLKNRKYCLRSERRADVTT